MQDKSKVIIMEEAEVLFETVWIDVKDDVRAVLKSEKTINEETFGIIRNDFALSYMEANKVDLNEDQIWINTFMKIGLDNKNFLKFATDASPMRSARK